MKRTSTWDIYVQEAMDDGDRAIEVPITEDESYIVPYPTRRQGRAIARATATGDTDGLVVALLGDECGERVKEMAEDYPAYVLDEFLLDVMRKFGMVEDKPDEDAEPAAEDAPTEDEKPAPKRRSAANGKTNGRATATGARRGKSTTPRTTSKAR